MIFVLQSDDKSTVRFLDELGMVHLYAWQAGAKQSCSVLKEDDSDRLESVDQAGPSTQNKDKKEGEIILHLRTRTMHFRFSSEVLCKQKR